MAGLSSSAIVGFISSGIKMGEKIVEFFFIRFFGLWLENLGICQGQVDA